MIELSFLCGSISPGKSYCLVTVHDEQKHTQICDNYAVHNVSPCVNRPPVEVINRTNKLTYPSDNFLIPTKCTIHTTYIHIYIHLMRISYMFRCLCIII